MLFTEIKENLKIEKISFVDYKPECEDGSSSGGPTTPRQHAEKLPAVSPVSLRPAETDRLNLKMHMGPQGFQNS